LVNIKEEGEEISFCDPKPKMAQNEELYGSWRSTPRPAREAWCECGLSKIWLWVGTKKRTMRVFLVSKVEDDYI